MLSTLFLSAGNRWSHELNAKFHFFICVYSALDKIIVQGYKALQLEYFFTAGPDEVKAWTIQVCCIFITFLISGALGGD